MNNHTDFDKFNLYAKAMYYNESGVHIEIKIGKIVRVQILE